METSLTIFYTHRLRGELALYPRLYTFLRRLRADHTAGGRILLLDLGESCSLEVFPCALTGGRSSLIVLDAMGYDAANVDGWLSEENRHKLADSHLHMSLVDSTHKAIIHQARVVTRCDSEAIGHPQPAPAALSAFTICLDPADATALHNTTLHLACLDGGQVGMVQIDRDEILPRLAAHQVFDCPADILPDPTIAAAVEFVLSEARYVQRKRGVTS
jgi:hypothetical protein